MPAFAGMTVGLERDDIPWDRKAIPRNVIRL
jgi:hypothetical protein